MKPSDFTGSLPFYSVLNNAEAELVARNIMIIMAELGNEWSPITWETYKKERIKDSSDFRDREIVSFRKVNKYCKSAEAAASFSYAWKDVYNNK